MATYVPNATQTTEPVESQTVESAALEFRTLKTSINSRVTALQVEVDAEEVTRAAADAALTVVDNALDVRTTALEQLAFNGSTPGTVVINKFIATASQTVFTLTVTPLTVATVDVYINGVYQNHDSFSLAANVVTLNEGVVEGYEVEIQASIALQLGVTDASLVEYLPAGTGAVATTVQAKLREFLSPEDKGAIGDNTTDDQLAFQEAIDEAYAVGGGTVRCAKGNTYKLSVAPIVKDKVTLDLNGSTLRLVLVGTGGYDYGVRVRNYAGVINGAVTVESSGSVGTQAGIHAPINVGGLSGDNGTVASPSADANPTGWRLQNLKVSTNRDGKAGIQVFGGASNGIIENIEAPDSSTMFGVVMLDWGFLGTITSSDIAASRVNFDAGTAYTTHPNNILIRNIKAGSMSRAKSGVDTGSHIVRLSGIYNVRVENVVAEQCTYAGVRITAGDVGFEFAPVAVKSMRMKGIVVDGVTVENTTDSWLVYPDSYADNVAAAVSGSGYTALIDPLHETDMEVKHVTGKGSGSVSATAGLDIRQIRGGRFTDIDAEGYSYGCLVDEQVYGVQIHGRFHGNRGHGIYLEHPSYPPEDVLILPGTHCYQNGQDAGFVNPAGIEIGTSVRCRVDGALFGHRTAASEVTQVRGLRVVGTGAVDVEVENCHAFSVKAGGLAYSLITTNVYGQTKLFRNNTAASAITNKMGGTDIIPINRFLGADGVERGQYAASRFALTADTTPMAGTWVTGDIIFHTNPSTGVAGTRCLTAGTPGTWELFG